MTTERPTINETKDALRLGACTILYEKLDGDIRVALGTLKQELIPEKFLPKNRDENRGPESETGDGLIHYFDIGSQGWRCFWLENLKSIAIQ